VGSGGENWRVSTEDCVLLVKCENKRYWLECSGGGRKPGKKKERETIVATKGLLEKKKEKSRKQTMSSETKQANSLGWGGEGGECIVLWGCCVL